MFLPNSAIRIPSTPYNSLVRDSESWFAASGNDTQSLCKQN